MGFHGALTTRREVSQSGALLAPTYQKEEFDEAIIKPVWDLV